MNRTHDRRNFLKRVAAVAAAAPIASAVAGRAAAATEPAYRVSLAEWSLHKTLFDGKLDHLEYAAYSKNEFGIDAVEYVNQFFADKAQDQKYLAELKKRGQDAGVKVLLIMIDREGDLGDPDETRRMAAVEKHHKWVEAAKFLGCHAIRVNARSRGEYAEQRKLAADGLRRLSDFAAPFGLNVIVENHGGLSSNGKWLASVIEDVGLSNCGTLPDFGNFKVSESETYDRYLGVGELMPTAKAVSAKSYDFDADGNETTIDYLKMMKIVTDAGYHGYVGIEYEGKTLSEVDGIHATKKLLERVRDELA